MALVAPDSDPYAITVVCTQPSHRSTIVVQIDYNASLEQWRRRPGQGKRVERENPLIGLYGDRVLDTLTLEEKIRLTRNNEGSRARWNIRCHLCGLAITAQSQRVDEICNRLRHAGEKRIDLKSLRTILS